MRHRSLDSVRGIAACVVVLCHTCLVFEASPLPAWFLRTPLRLLVSGSAAVTVFFVLSGIVLSLGFVDGSIVRFGTFATQRITRIYIPFVAAIAASLALQLALQPTAVAEASGWLNRGTWDQWPTIGQITKAFLMTGTYNQLDNPMWSLVHELRISLIFPILVLLAKSSWRISIVGSVTLSVASVVLSTSMPGELAVSFVRSGIYIVAFVAGITLTLNMTIIQRWLQARSVAMRVMLWCAALMGLSIAPLESGRIANGVEAMQFLVTVAAAFGLLALAVVEGRAKNLLTARVPLFLGQISYSLYLTHVIVIAAVVHGMPIGVPIAVKVGAALAITIPIAVGFHFAIERHSRLAGQQVIRAVTNLFGGGRPAQAALRV